MPDPTPPPAAGPPLRYELLATDSNTRARLGRVTTRHGIFDTPAFMPVGTQGTLKGLLPSMVAETGAQCVLANTYHLMLRPGERVVAELGDLHRFMSWPGPILTDSGGFQVFSLSDLNRITDDGVTFKSHVDGATVHLTPERSMAVQNALGADIMMAFDECPPSDAPLEYQLAAVDRTLRWAERCKASHAQADAQSLFAIVQGGTDDGLRARCAERLMGMDFPGYAVGGLAVGEGFEAMCKVLDGVVHRLPDDRPRYLMGVGFPRDIVAAVAAGIDMFDCVMPTRNGRNAFAFTAGGAIRLKNAKFTRDGGPIEAGCDCHACLNFTRGAIRHYFFAGEMLGPILVSLHNVRFYQRLMRDVRTAIAAGRFDAFRRDDPRATLGPAGGGAAATTSEGEAGGAGRRLSRPESARAESDVAEESRRLSFAPFLADAPATAPAVGPTVSVAPVSVAPVATQPTVGTVSGTPAGPTPAASDPPALLKMFQGPLPLIIIAIFAFMAFNGKGRRTEEKTRQAMLKALKRGDKIQTIGGIQGTVVTVEEKRVSVKVDETKDTKMWFARTAIAQVLVETAAGDKVVEAK